MIDLPDINVWIALAYSRHTQHIPATKYIATVQADSAALCRLSQVGMLRLLTNPAVMGSDVCTQVKAWSHFDQLMSDPRILFLEEPSNLEPEWRTFSSLSKPAANQWADGYLAAFAVSHG